MIRIVSRSDHAWLLSVLGLATSGWITALSTASAQEDPTPFVIGEVVTIDSDVLEETRRLIIGKPAGYETGDARYPVMYLLDGGGHFHHTSGVTCFLAMNGRIPDMLVVAITNTDRTRDLTPPSVEQEDIARMPTQGGAANFLRFIRDELKPWVEQNYRTLPHSTLIGHSFGGLFAIDTLVTEPDVFDAYIAISPSLQWNGQRLVEQAEVFFDHTPELPKRLYLTAGNEGGALLGGIRKLAGVLDEKAPMGFEWHFEPMPTQSHNSVPHLSTYDGLEFVFTGFHLPDIIGLFDREGITGLERFYKESGRTLGLDRKVPLDTFGELVGRLLQANRFDDVAGLVDRAQDPEVFSPPLPNILMVQLLTRLAGGYEGQGERERAIRIYRRMIEVDSGNEVARAALDRLDTQL